MSVEKHMDPLPINKNDETGGVHSTTNQSAPWEVVSSPSSSSASSLDEHRRQLAVKTLNLRVGTTPESAKNKRQEIFDTFDAHFALYESLFSVLTEEAHYVRADRLRHPLIFYLGHTAAFYVNKLVLMGIIDESERIDPEVEELVAVGVDEMSWDDLLPDGYPWPTVSKMYEFRNKVHALVTDVVMNRIKLECGDLIDWSHPFWAVVMGIEHERIHLETSAVLIRQIPLTILHSKAVDDIWTKVCPNWRSDLESVPKNSFAPIAGGKVVLGRSLGSQIYQELDEALGKSSVYGWDNEYGFHSADVKGFQVSKQLVSNADWLEFIKDGGYEKRQLWSEEGWGWVSFIKPKHALFWVEKEDSFVLRNLISETESMPWDWPVEVNALEASAYCRWVSERTNLLTRLPTEDDWNLMMSQHSPYMHDSKSEDPDEFLPQGNIGLKFASSTPVDSFASGNLYDVCGNVWQWCKTPTYPFEGFQVHKIYLDFTFPTFDDKHNMIKGGSWVTTGNEATRFSRYAFRRHFFQFAGFRLVQTGERFDPLVFEPDFESKNDLMNKGWKTFQS